MIRIKIKDPSWVWHEFVGDSKSSITEQCEARDIDSPFACRAGACTMCACKVEKGQEYLIQNKFWEKLVDVDDDQFLCCIGGFNDADVDSDEEYEVVMGYE